MIEVGMPRLSDSMEEGTLIKWLKRDGDRVMAGDELVEVETDKATVTVSAQDEGVLSVVAAEGTTVAVGEVIARVAPASEDLDVAPDIADEATAGPAQVVAPAAPAVPAQTNGHGAATPLARRAAARHGVELAAVAGTGPRGRITRDDVLDAAGVARPQARAPALTPAPAPAAAPPAPALAAAPPAPDGAGGLADARPFTRLQQLIARRMSESRTAIPEFEVQTDVVMDEALALRERLRGAVGEDQPLPSLNDLIVRASALTLRRHPRLNASYSSDALQVWPNVNIGIAVAGEDALIVPVVRDADTLSLGQIARESRRLAERVRAGQIGPAELEGGTFTVSNLGMYGMTAIRPVINFPQVAILGVGAVRDTLARVDGEIVDRHLMTLTLSADHRAVYGADAARFLADLRDLLQAPLGILL
jgi:pyruvate dehydrogenase E2 component (dihydrolipoyllysine-residue acetyltransferase)